jgi:hypothetical protein
MPVEVTIAVRFPNMSGQEGAKWCVATMTQIRIHARDSEAREGIKAHQDTQEEGNTMRSIWV